MPTLSINNIDVDFPKVPYQCQIDYMSKVLTALEHGSNALLESPTGTGKTLTLLCSTLAWQNSIRKRKIDIKSTNILAAGSSGFKQQQGGNISENLKLNFQNIQPYTSM